MIKTIYRVKILRSSREKIISVTVAAEINETKIMKIEVCKFEDNFFDDTSIIVDCTLNFEDEYKIKAMINNNCIDYFFINIIIAQKICDSLRITFLKLNKFREVKNYDERKNKNIIHVIYSFMIIQNYTKSSIFMMIIKLNQHSIILEKI
jgi:hypothetical protein